MSCGLWILLCSHRLSEFRWGYWHCAAASSCCSAERNQSITNKLKNNIITEKSTLHPILNPEPKPNNNCFLPYKGEIVTRVECRLLITDVAVFYSVLFPIQSSNVVVLFLKTFPDMSAYDAANASPMTTSSESRTKTTHAKTDAGSKARTSCSIRS